MLVAPAPSPRRRWPRRLAALLAAFVVLNLVALVGASWYYSDRIESDALRAVPGAWDRPFTVSAVDPAAGTISLSPVAGSPGLAWQERDLTGIAMVEGLHWEGGFALSQGTDSDPGPSVLRQARLTEGTWPAVGAPIGAHTFAHPHGITTPWQQVTFPGPEGPLEAAFQPGTGATWLVAAHGKGAEPNEFSRMAPVAVALGMPTLAIRYRGDVDSPPADNGRVGFGSTEWPDLDAAVRYAVAHGAEHVVLMGASMGGAIVASYLRHAKDTSVVTAVVLDSPALSLQRTVEWGAAQIAFPGGLSLPAPVTWGAERLTSWRFGLDWHATDYVSDTRWADRPTLVFHGDADTTVPIATSREFAAADPQVTLIETPGAEHVASWNVDPMRYENALRDFLAPFASTS